MNTCNQCEEQMNAYVIPIMNDKIYLSVCDKPKCPNYGILQVPREQMTECIKELGE